MEGGVMLGGFYIALGMVALIGGWEGAQWMYREHRDRLRWLFAASLLFTTAVYCTYYLMGAGYFLLQ
jgi:uncharacterized membrane protein YfcA